ncbi:hypothetical protein PSTG_03291 [Puccinia striiformis f. sp. tritici PST-78]|uniref:Clr5 domain-containing protein n=1 Tax=Puccinia striiformis f. sp. tritici PST-78 TaxID=1165861 RepID=A0A0L0VVP1_9BASI|nr:hypothetical protein PSTG_03291 [Puccinia striiformis f. sp. tritici PST-78]
MCQVGPSNAASGSNENLGLSDEEFAWTQMKCWQQTILRYLDLMKIPSATCHTRTHPLSPNQHRGAHLRTHKKKIVKRLLFQGHKGPKIVQILQEEHDIVTNLRSLSQNRQKWKLQHWDLQKPPPPPPLLPHIRASILSSNSKGLNLKEIQAWLSQETNIQVCIQTVKRYLKRLNVKLLVNNVADGTVTMEQVFEAVNHARQTLLHDQAAYRRMQMVYNVLEQLDPGGMEARLCRTLIRCVYRVQGPHHIWAAYGHDKLKKYGICVSMMLSPGRYLGCLCIQPITIHIMLPYIFYAWPWRLVEYHTKSPQTSEQKLFKWVPTKCGCPLVMLELQ